MIYYSLNHTLFTKNIMTLVTNEYDLVSEKFEFNLESDVGEMIDKWVDRYHLLETAQQKYRRRLNQEPVFSLIINFSYNWLDADEKERWTKFENQEPIEVQKVTLYLFCRTSDDFLYDEKNQRILSKTDKNDLRQINRRIFEKCPSAEIFKPLQDIDPIKVEGKYELVRITKPKKSAKDLQAKNWVHEKHATDWTWRMTNRMHDLQLEQGKRVVLRFQNLIEKGASLEEKMAYFERHFKALEGYLGYRGVRQQIGNLYHLERKLFERKYNASWFEHGARNLKLSYIKKTKNTIANNTPYIDAIRIFEEKLLDHIKINYKKWQDKQSPIK